MSQASKFDLRGVAVALAGGCVVILIATQLLAKPGANSGARSSGNRVVIRPQAEGTELQPGPQLALAGGGVRNLFRPLVQPKKDPGLVITPAPAPARPAPASAPPAPSATPSPASGPSAPQAPSGPQASEIQMLGVVELGDDVKVLLRRSTTGESRYFAKGEDAFGFKVEDIKATEVALSHNGRTEQVAMSTEVVLEGPGNAAVAGQSGFSGGGSFGGDSGRRFGRREGGGRDGGGGSNPTSEIMALPTWTERLKKLDELKAQLPADQYTRLREFIARRAAEEKK